MTRHGRHHQDISRRSYAAESYSGRATAHDREVEARIHALCKDKPVRRDFRVRFVPRAPQGRPAGRRGGVTIDVVVQALEGLGGGPVSAARIRDRVCELVERRVTEDTVRQAIHDGNRGQIRRIGKGTKDDRYRYELKDGCHG